MEFPQVYTSLHNYFVAKVIVLLMVVSATSIHVSWDRVEISEVTGYRVYYTLTVAVCTCAEQFIDVSGSDNSVTIDNLLTDVEYQFQVVAVAELDGDVIVGERSNVSASRPTATLTTTPPPANTEAQC